MQKTPAAIVALILIFQAFGALATPKQQAAPDPQQEMDATARRLVGHELLDEGSANYRFSHQTLQFTMHHEICGCVNAKNRMGGYVGFVPFWVDSSGKAHLSSPGVTADVIGQTCKQRGFTDLDC